MQLTWQQPQNYRNRPVVILGAGVLGRRIGCIWASAGYEVRIRDPSEQQRADGLAYIQENVDEYAQKTGQKPGKYSTHEDMKEAVANAWLVIEAVPEKLELKIATFAELEALAPEDCILASNSSSYKSSEMIEKVSDATKARILNMHYYMPPGCMIVELMTNGFTDEGVFPFMVEKSKEAATLPYVARKQSTGFIFNRLWAAVKREVLTILAEGVSVPEEIDSMWTEMFIKPRSMPCRTMDQVGLDTVAFIEGHYIEERGLSPEKTVDFLKRNYLDDGRLGNKSAKGGLYPPVKEEKATVNNESTLPELLVLDIGLSAANPTATSGEILKLSSDGKIEKVLAPNQSLPDGIVVDTTIGRMFWTCMGVPGKDDGAVYSANLDGSGIQTVVPRGRINTPKQLTIDAEAQKVYFCDREGCRVWRCGYDGSDLEAVIDRSTSKDAYESAISHWCVGITVAPSLGKFYWTQKGPSKGGKGRIFCANITTPEGQTGASRDDIQLVLSDLPEPIDLELDEQSQTLYWTDRGEVPLGNALFRAQLDGSGLPVSIKPGQKYEVLTKHLKEAIGLKLDLSNGHIYLTDLGGNIYRCDLDGSHKEKIYSDDYRAFTGIAIL
ncbi:3-hydroxyacyl-CoA dehydrogenase, NAD binding domain [Aspergillus nomiae NRRL 13137]|uniref:3-hydroxyacyl-CoA dehydrogenase, NAD binding domain n=1 Tax=Aspergillus nomiae NRRL (strain ATCC 15546 / NRRL 13137 / CBS 260.88 / M93) TaxID=1509407 RepID=A0A0L1IYX7_ASPN3|nr:3-hydroxyacyl-CoA dehydrogenase, NAD binding domain [Aspergillus nomiae NRRL 13137]KNG84368.1 3-hydroxyacyl-CoA dehydrogenase, NAD binding domain [Aspergillus nomiae NRRL 13137]